MPELSENERRLQIWNGMTAEQRDYDRFVARIVPLGASRLPETAKGRDMQRAMHDTNDPDRGCSCHINPPCSYCESLRQCELCEFENFIPEDDMDVHLDAEHPLAAPEEARP